MVVAGASTAVDAAASLPGVGSVAVTVVVDGVPLVTALTRVWLETAALVFLVCV